MNLVGMLPRNNFKVIGGNVRDIFQSPGTLLLSSAKLYGNICQMEYFISGVSSYMPIKILNKKVPICLFTKLYNGNVSRGKGDHKDSS